jgi:arylsulfatase A-like enzyme
MVAGPDTPRQFGGHAVPPLEGHSLRPTFEGRAFGREALCWEHEGNRAVRKGDWKLVCKYPGDWELYDLGADRTELNDLSGQHPEIAAEMSALYDAWARRCHVMPWADLLALRRRNAERPAPSRR